MSSENQKQFFKVRLITLIDELKVQKQLLEDYENEQNEVPFKLNLTYELLNDKTDELSNNIWNIKTEIDDLIRYLGSTNISELIAEYEDYVECKYTIDYLKDIIIQLE